MSVYIELFVTRVTQCFEGMLIQFQLRWVGHIKRKHDHILPKIPKCCRLREGQRNGRIFQIQKERLKDGIR